MMTEYALWITEREAKALQSALRLYRAQRRNRRKGKTLTSIDHDIGHLLTMLKEKHKYEVEF